MDNISQGDTVYEEEFQAGDIIVNKSNFNLSC